MQIPSQKAQARRCAEALQLQLAAAHKLVEDRRKGVTDAQTQASPRLPWCAPEVLSCTLIGVLGVYQAP